MKERGVTDLIFEGLRVLIGEEGKDFIFYRTIDELFERLDLLNPYRNPDRTFASLIWTCYG